MDRDEVYKYYSSLIGDFTDPCVGTLYHYTSAEALQGIVQNHELWLTNVEFVNDLEECKALPKEKTLFSKNEFKNKEIYESWKRLFLPELDIPTSTYIISFSTGEKESLSQWRSYGSYRIGFDASKLKENYNQLFQCLYSREDIRNWILDKDKSKYWDKLEKLKNIVDNKKGERKNIEAIYNAKGAAAFYLIEAAQKKYKNEYFEDEKEYRMIEHSNPNWFYVNSPGMYFAEPPIHYRKHHAYDLPIPYIKYFLKDRENQPPVKEVKASTYEEMKKYKLEEEKTVKRLRLPITEVMVGPIPNRDKEAASCKIFLRDNGYTNVKVTTSDIPYRGF